VSCRRIVRSARGNSVSGQKDSHPLALTVWDGGKIAAIRRFYFASFLHQTGELLQREEGLQMPKEDDTKTAHCKKCERETTWIYRIFMLGKEIWECMTCGTRYYV